MAARYDKAKEYTLKYREKLKPCYYCGSHDIVVYADKTIFGKKQYVWGVNCTNCGDCVRPDTSVRRVVDNWNTHIEMLMQEKALANKQRVPDGSNTRVAVSRRISRETQAVNKKAVTRVEK